jgi:hypothetical protein
MTHIQENSMVTINEQFNTTERITGEFKVPIYFSITLVL